MNADPDPDPQPWLTHIRSYKNCLFEFTNSICVVLCHTVHWYLHTYTSMSPEALTCVLCNIMHIMQ